MRIIVDICHPAQVHLFRYMLEAWKKQGVETLVLARDKDITFKLLRSFGIPYEVLADAGLGTWGYAKEFFKREAAMFRVARRFRPKVITGSSPNAPRICKLIGAKSVILAEDDAKYIPRFRWLAYPLASAIVNPDGLAYENYGVRHWTYPSYQKLFYLHPNRFTPDVNVLRELGIDEKEPYAIVRLSSLQAHHDTTASGMNEALLHQVMALAKNKMRVYITSERPLPAEFEKHRLTISIERIHHALAFADFFLGDSQSMTVESALLGTPAFKFNTFAGIISVIRELEEAGLAYGFRPGQEKELLAELSTVLELPDRKRVYQERRKQLLREKIDPLPWYLSAIKMLLDGATVPEVKAWSTRALAGRQFHAAPSSLDSATCLA